VTSNHKRFYTVVKYDHKKITFILKSTYFSCFSSVFDREYLNVYDIFFNDIYNNKNLTVREKNIIITSLLNKQLALYNSETPSASYYRL